MDRKIARIERALAQLSGHEACCTLCPRECRVKRKEGEVGICQSGVQASLSHALIHYGEEPVLSGRHSSSPDSPKSQEAKLSRGSGTIFFTGCNLKCLFCQNYQLSWLTQGRTVSDQELAAIMLDLQNNGAYNINLVSPTHLIIPILRALKIAYARGLRIPIVYNSSGYEKVDIVEKLAGIIDVYLPDLKYFSPEVSAKFSGAPDYFSHAHLTIQEMYCQQPALILDDQEIAQKGLIIRHLILPGQTADSLAILDWLAHHLPRSVSLSLMSQYHPCFQAPAEIQRPLAAEEYQAVLTRAKDLGFESLFIQPEGFEPDEHLVPDFSRPGPFKWR
jgi:putative pyruvate formate lyase activating enzyme